MSNVSEGAFSALLCTVIVATHDASLIERYEKRTLRLERGTLVADSRGEKAARLMAHDQ